MAIYVFITLKFHASYCSINDNDSKKIDKPAVTVIAYVPRCSLLKTTYSFAAIKQNQISTFKEFEDFLYVRIMQIFQYFDNDQVEPVRVIPWYAMQPFESEHAWCAMIKDLHTIDKNSQ